MAVANGSRRGKEESLWRMGAEERRGTRIATTTRDRPFSSPFRTRENTLGCGPTRGRAIFTFSHSLRAGGCNSVRSTHKSRIRDSMHYVLEMVLEEGRSDHEGHDLTAVGHVAPFPWSCA
jgi:hypothetical protein